MSTHLLADDAADDRPIKRPKLVEQDDVAPLPQYLTGNLLPPSRLLLPVSTQLEGYGTSEADVGITEYISSDVPRIEGIIKQRFTDFLVFEVDLQDDVVHLKTVLKPQEPSVVYEEPARASDSVTIPAPQVDDNKPASVSGNLSGSWPESAAASLSQFLAGTAILQLQDMFLEGPEPPFVSDSGWGGGKRRDTDLSQSNPQDIAQHETYRSDPMPETRSRGGRGRSRGSRGRSGRPGAKREDTRRVISEPIPDKSRRGELHQKIRFLFGGKLESETYAGDDVADNDANRVVIRWAHGKGRERGPKPDQPDRRGRKQGDLPAFIHFTMQKTNRDTHDALSGLSRLLRVNVHDLGVAGTKDKRGVTVQRVSLRRQGKTLETVWRMANNLHGRRTLQDVSTLRAERGVRVGDLAYSKHGLELGMLNGNAFVITLRGVKTDTADAIQRAMESIQHKGFINYFGMQRFGTAMIPTHSIGLALLQSDWQRAVSLILRPRPGEHPDAEAGRRAWLEESDIKKALQLLPRRVVAERCILENFQKQGGDGRNCMGALSTIPRNLRTMYVHAYQSYIWNAVVSHRIKLYGAGHPVVGDIVFDASVAIAASSEGRGEDSCLEPADETLPLEFALRHGADPRDTAAQHPVHKRRKPFAMPAVKVLTAVDLPNYSIFDVVMPLPGHDIVYPGGELGELYRKFLHADGLDPNNLARKHKEYSLLGAYRKILHQPKDLSWSALGYTDPDVPLAQSDEDALLGFDAPAIAEEGGKFLALQIRFRLASAAYATMALREVTKTETSSHFQSMLTKSSDDQQFKGVGTEVDAEEAGQ